MKAGSVIEVSLNNGKPSSVNGQQVSQILDIYRIWPNWWEGYGIRNYYLLEIGEKSLEIYQVEGHWYLVRTLD